MQLKDNEIVLLLGTDSVIVTAAVVGTEEISGGIRFTLRTSARVSHYSELRGGRGRFAICKVEQCRDQWIVEGRRRGG